MGEKAFQVLDLESNLVKALLSLSWLGTVPRELQALKDFLKRRYNLLDMSAMRDAYYGLDSWLFSL